MDEHARLLELVNASEERARRVTVELSAADVDVSHWLLSDVPRLIAPRGRVQLLLADQPGPQDVDLSVRWDDRGIPGLWHGVCALVLSRASANFRTSVPVTHQ